MSPRSEDARFCFFSGGLQVGDARLARQSSAANGKPALWRRRVELAPRLDC
jgi:hypothetical protein